MNGDIGPTKPQFERMVLGCMMIAADVRENIKDELITADFAVVRNQWVFDAICNLGDDVDVVLVCDELRKTGQLASGSEGDGVDPGYVAKLATDLPTTLNWRTYVERVRFASVKRRLTTLALRVTRESYDETRDPQEIIDELKTALDTWQSWSNTPAGWQVYTLVDAYEPRPPVTYLVQDLFSLPSLNIVYGAPGGLKSMLVLDAALCVASGKPWLQALPGKTVLPLPTIQAPVLWLDFDNGARRTHERVGALGRAHGLEANGLFYYVAMPSPWLDASDQSSVNGLIELARRTLVGMIVVDNLSTVSGGADENSTEMVGVLSNFRRLAEETGTAVVMIHHQRKTKGVKARIGESLRGHSSIEAALDLALLVAREPGEPVVKIASTKTRGIDVAPFSAIFTYDHRLGTSELETARFFGVPMLDDRKPARARRAVLEAVDQAEEPLGRGVLIDQAKEIDDDIGVKYYRQTIETMVHVGDLLETKGERNARFLARP